jgi:hypothetical protein
LEVPVVLPAWYETKIVAVLPGMDTELISRNGKNPFATRFGKLNVLGKIRVFLLGNFQRCFKGNSICGRWELPPQ